MKANIISKAQGRKGNRDETSEKWSKSRKKQKKESQCFYTRGNFDPPQLLGDLTGAHQPEMSKVLMVPWGAVPASADPQHGSTYYVDLAVWMASGGMNSAWNTIAEMQLWEGTAPPPPFLNGGISLHSAGKEILAHHYLLWLRFFSVPPSTIPPAWDPHSSYRLWNCWEQNRSTSLSEASQEEADSSFPQYLTKTPQIYKCSKYSRKKYFYFLQPFLSKRGDFKASLILKMH